MEILVVGDYCKDEFVYCSCDRLSPEACVPIAVPMLKEVNNGMAANVLENIKSLSRESVNVCGVFSKCDIRKTRYIHKDSGQQIVRVDTGEANIKPLTKEEFNEIFDRYPSRIDAVVISDYNKGFISEDIIGHISKKCRKNDIPTFLDTKKVLGEWSKLVTIVKINEKEYQILKKHLEKPEDYCQNLIVTRGSLGMYHVNSKYLSVTKPVEVSCVAGCGDTALAAITLEYLRSGNIIKCMDFANIAAGCAATKPNVVAVKYEWLQ